MEPAPTRNYSAREVHLALDEAIHDYGRDGGPERADTRDADHPVWRAFWIRMNGGVVPDRGYDARC